MNPFLSLIDSLEEVSRLLKGGGVAVIPTDTIYGIVASAFLPDAVERVYEIKNRNKSKPLIVLIGALDSLDQFGITLSKKQKEILSDVWPGATSVILNVEKDDYKYIHRGGKSIAFRLPADSMLRDFLIKTGPLVAPSANPEGMPFPKNIEEAKEYFGAKIDIYIDGGELKNQPSRLMSLSNSGEIEILRGSPQKP